MTAEQLLVSQRVHNLPDTVLATGERAEQLHPFSSHMSRATLYAGKLVWCNGTSASGALEGVKLPVQTAVGLPLRSHVGGGAAFVLYSMRRLEQSTSVTYFVAQLQVLAAASHAASAQVSAKREAESALAASTHAAASSGATAPSSSSTLDVSDGAPAADMWVTPEAVMSTEQVMSLIDCLGPEKANGASGVPPPIPLGESRMDSGIPLDDLVNSTGANFASDTYEAFATHTPAAQDPAGASTLNAGASLLHATGCTAEDLSAALCR